MKRFLATPIAEAFTPLVVGITLLFIIALAADHIAFPATPAPKVGYSSAYIPAPRAFCLTNVQGIVSSAYANESSLVGNTPPVEDSDYQLLPYVSERFCLPGDVRDHYTYDGAVDIPGSGWVEEWSIGHGGRIAFLHLQNIITGLPGLALEACSVMVDGLDHTADCLPPALPRTVGVSSYHGGQYVGSSGWPSSFAYSNGSCDSYAYCSYRDPHLCLTGNAAGIAYLEMIAHRGPLPKPFVFPIRAWGSRYSPYVKGTHRLTWPASIFVAHRVIGWATGPFRYYAGHPGYNKYRFSKSDVFAFPTTGRIKIVRR